MVIGPSVFGPFSVRHLPTGTCVRLPGISQTYKISDPSYLGTFVPGSFYHSFPVSTSTRLVGRSITLFCLESKSLSV